MGHSCCANELWRGTPSPSTLERLAPSGVLLPISVPRWVQGTCHARPQAPPHSVRLYNLLLWNDRPQRPHNERGPLGVLCACFAAELRLGITWTLYHRRLSPQGKSGR